VKRSSSSQAGSDVQKYIFSNPGPINIRIENVAGNQKSFSDFNSTIYENQNISGHMQMGQSESSNLPSNPFKVSNLTLIGITYTIIAIIPAAVAVVYILYKKRII
jgi:hypothetical protein